MNINELLNDLTKLEQQANGSFREYELRLIPDGSGSIHAVYKPELPRTDALLAVATMPQLYQAEVAFSNWDELATLHRLIVTDPESFESSMTLVDK